ncbi:unnamed protein product [Darwinula stevensoni]|uniref:Invertebrate defensins family profile domain-containing protein n=1 Tax=Darwinula stevensoni TaxID=69355 RepID=A0A7R9AF76_9CRUS|nr:unnamed protein product [Darwinula stevensoni]CAG0903024.1 unnamed protein product [Darwinula stevensoni]
MALPHEITVHLIFGENLSEQERFELVEGSEIEERRRMKPILLMIFAVVVFAAIARVDAGFGCCPVCGDYECSNHCQSVGRAGGYCGGWHRFTCICYRTKK